MSRGRHDSGFVPQRYDVGGKQLTHEQLADLFGRSHDPRPEDSPFRSFVIAFVGGSALLIVLLLFLSASGDDAGAQLAERDCAVEHRIVPGDTLSQLARTAGVDYQTLAYWNKVSNADVIHVDDILCLSEPGWVAGDVRGSSVSDLLAEPDWTAVTIPGNGGGDSQPPFDVRAAAWQAFGRHGIDVYVQSLEIARCESSFRADAHRTTSNPARLIGDRGVWQMNYIHDGVLANHGIIERPEDLFDPHTNAQAALFLFERAGNSWQDWVMSGHCHGYA